MKLDDQNFLSTWFTWQNNKQTQGLTNLALTFLRFGEQSKAWLGWINHQNTLRVGKQWQCGKTTHAFEARYDNSPRAIGFLALPVFLAYGRRCQASENTSIEFGLELEDDFVF